MTRCYVHSVVQAHEAEPLQNRALSGFAGQATLAWATF
jgi:hypothetical protein